MNKQWGNYELKWMFDYCIYLAHEDVSMMIIIRLNKLSIFNWFSC
jgi:hypothetical protein